MLAGLRLWRLLTSNHTSSAGLLLAAVAAAALTDAIVDTVLGGLIVALRGTGSWRTFVLSVRPLFVSCLALYIPLISLLVYSYEQVGAWTVLLFFAPSFTAQSLYRLYRQERATADRLKNANTKLESANLSFATALVATLDARDQYTAGHSAAVAVYARDIAERLGLSCEEQKMAHLCGLVHDIGKIGLPPGLLDKPGALTLEERRQMEMHSAIGERILANVDDYAEIARIVRHHHERVDGQGYPDGLARGRDPTDLTNHLRSRRVQRHDFGPAISRRDAQPGSLACGSPKLSRASSIPPLLPRSRQSWRLLPTSTAPVCTLRSPLSDVRRLIAGWPRWWPPSSSFLARRAHPGFKAPPAYAFLRRASWVNMPSGAP